MCMMKASGCIEVTTNTEGEWSVKVLNYHYPRHNADVIYLCGLWSVCIYLSICLPCVHVCYQAGLTERSDGQLKLEGTDSNKVMHALTNSPYANLKTLAVETILSPVSTCA